MQDIDYNELNAYLVNLGADQGAADFHGLICGSLMQKSDSSVTQALQRVMSVFDLDDIGLKQLEPLAQKLRQASRIQLEDDELSFSLLLPDDQVELPVRLSAVVKWCEGFLAGIGLVQTGSDALEEKSLKEILNDIKAIISVQTDVDENDENENYYSEIVEYIRMAVIMLFTELALKVEIPHQPSTTDNQRLH